MAIMLTYIAGVNHRPPEVRQRLGQLIQGEQLTLAREPDNAFDKNAVAVYDGELKLGYVPAVDAPAVSRALAETAVRVHYRGEPSTTSILVAWGDD